MDTLGKKTAESNKGSKTKYKTQPAKAYQNKANRDVLTEMQT